MRGRLPLPPFPGLPPAETPAAANTRGRVKTPPYGPRVLTPTPGPGMPGPYRAAARERLPA